MCPMNSENEIGKPTCKRISWAGAFICTCLVLYKQCSALFGMSSLVSAICKFNLISLVSQMEMISSRSVCFTGLFPFPNLFIIMHFIVLNFFFITILSSPNTVLRLVHTSSLIYRLILANLFRSVLIFFFFFKSKR